ncbi:MAG: FAD-dependent oxidoreductase [Bacteroidota bacterium]
MLDYLIVGLGLAGISFAEVLEQHGKSFKVLDDDSQKSSKVAGGLYNPVILKRFTLAWEAQKQLEMAMPFYQDLEGKLGVALDYKVPVLRRFASVEEQNLWFQAADRPGLDRFLSTQIQSNQNPAIRATYGYGQVLHTGRIATHTLVETYKAYLSDKNVLLKDTFDHKSLTILDAGIDYKGIKAKRIVFAEGFGLRNNIFFNYLPLNGSKGELLTLHAPELKEQNVIKSSVFIIPLGNDRYRIGATYQGKDKTQVPTQEAREQLVQKLDTFLECNYTVVDHVAGIRPTVADRRPLIGRHPEHPRLYVLNGFGSRGVMIAPFAAQQLFGHIEEDTPLLPQMDIARYVKRHNLSLR